MESTRAVQHRADPAAWRVRVLTADGRAAGAGVLLPGAVVLTCAHVVETVLARPPSTTAPEGALRVDFPAAPGAPQEARVAADGWFRDPPAADLALLSLTDPPSDDVRPAPVDLAEPSDGAEVRAFGHPARLPEGVWTRARTVAAGGPHPGWWQLEGLDRVGMWVQPGFSGAGVLDPRRGRVVGVVVSMYSSRETAGPRVAWMIPLSLLAGRPAADGWTTALTAPGEARPLPPLAGDGPAPDAVRDLWDVAEALLDVTGIAADGGKGLLALLPRHIGSGVPRDERPRLQALHLVRRCGDFADGPAALVRVVRQVEGDTLPVRRFVARAERLWPHRLAGGGAAHA